MSCNPQATHARRGCARITAQAMLEAHLETQEEPRMSTQSEDYQNLEKLERQLVEERRFEVARLARNDVSLMDAGQRVIELNAMLEAVRAAKKEEYEIQGISGMMG